MKRAVVVIASIALFSLAGVTQARVPHGWLGWNHAKQAIRQHEARSKQGTLKHFHITRCWRLNVGAMRCAVASMWEGPAGPAPCPPGANCPPSWGDWTVHANAIFTVRRAPNGRLHLIRRLRGVVLTMTFGTA